mmetsp:Transcript_35852/g.59772  ORF Transcript_35852/g.59772 Transcript_35852/m.59772 type:complete len:95 (+) Transcript_35852:55-339(+)
MGNSCSGEPKLDEHPRRLDDDTIVHPKRDQNGFVNPAGAPNNGPIVLPANISPEIAAKFSANMHSLVVTQKEEINISVKAGSAYKDKDPNNFLT